MSLFDRFCSSRCCHGDQKKQQLDNDGNPMEKKTKFPSLSYEQKTKLVDNVVKESFRLFELEEKLKASQTIDEMKRWANEIFDVTIKMIKNTPMSEEDKIKGIAAANEQREAYMIELLMADRMHKELMAREKEPHHMVSVF